MVETQTKLKVADETWIATALLHREFPEREDFTAKEIEERARVENITGELRKGVYVHAVLHCVANKAPNPGRYRMLFATTGTRRRLYRPGDTVHLGRSSARARPEREDLPEQYRYLLDWYRDWAGSHEVSAASEFLASRGITSCFRSAEEADAWVAHLRED